MEEVFVSICSTMFDGFEADGRDVDLLIQRDFGDAAVKATRNNAEMIQIL